MDKTEERGLYANLNEGRFSPDEKPMTPTPTPAAKSIK
jgi:hypothetical protein